MRQQHMDTRSDRLTARPADGPRFTAHSSGEPPTDGRFRLLVVDDCHEHLQAMSTVLMELGYEVRVAHNGELALSQVNEFQPHGVLLDVNMPVMDGYELAQILRTYLQDQTVLIGMSGADVAGDGTTGISSLVDGWFPKPLDLGELERCLARLLRAKTVSLDT